MRAAARGRQSRLTHFTQPNGAPTAQLSACSRNAASLRSSKSLRRASRSAHPIAGFARATACLATKNKCLADKNKTRTGGKRPTSSLHPGTLCVVQIGAASALCRADAVPPQADTPNGTTLSVSKMVTNGAFNPATRWVRLQGPPAGAVAARGRGRNREFALRRAPAGKSPSDDRGICVRSVSRAGSPLGRRRGNCGGPSHVGAKDRKSRCHRCRESGRPLRRRRGRPCCSRRLTVIRSAYAELIGPRFLRTVRGRGN